MTWSKSTISGRAYILFAIQPSRRSIPLFLCEFGCLKQQVRQTKAMEYSTYVRQSETIKVTTIGSKKRSFPLPVVGEATDPYFVCKPAFQNIVNIKRFQWKSLASQCQANRMEANKGHHLNGRTGVKAKRSIDPELVAALPILQIQRKWVHQELQELFVMNWEDLVCEMTMSR
jgi:hypothetical protein